MLNSKVNLPKKIVCHDELPRKKCTAISGSFKLVHNLNNSSEKLLFIAKQFFKWISIYLTHSLILHSSYGIKFRAHVTSSTSAFPDFPADSLPYLRLLTETPWACFMITRKTALMGSTPQVAARTELWFAEGFVIHT